MTVHHVAHGHHVSHVRRPAGVPELTPRRVDTDMLHRWRTTGRLCAADVLTILADRDPADPLPVGSYVARLRAAS